MIRKTVFALALSLSLLGTANAQEAEPLTGADAISQDGNFSVCNTNEDCAIAAGLCGNWIAINKTSEPVYQQFVSMMRGKGNCPEKQKAAKPSAVLCTNHICQIPGQPSPE